MTCCHSRDNAMPPPIHLPDRASAHRVLKQREQKEEDLVAEVLTIRTLPASVAPGFQTWLKEVYALLDAIC